MPKRTKRAVPETFVKTPFHERSGVIYASEVRQELGETTFRSMLNKTKVEKWSDHQLGAYMTAMNRGHSIEMDDGTLLTLMTAFETFATGRKDFMEALDPHFVFVNWGAVLPQAVENWVLPTALQGADVLTPVPEFPNCYTVPNHDLGHALAGALASQFPGVRAFTWDTPNPIPSYRV